MLKLEDIKKDAQVRGIQAEEIVRVVQVEPVGDVLVKSNLTTLPPDIVEAILDDQLPPTVTLFDLAVDPPRLWSQQRQKLLV